MRFTLPFLIGQAYAFRAAVESDTLFDVHATTEKDPSGCAPVPQFIQDRYGPMKLLGVGATGCGWAGVDKEGQGSNKDVVVKITKKTGKQKKMDEFCAVMDHIHAEACKLGGDDLKLARMHIPVCLDHGEDPVSHHGYTVMSNGGEQAIGRADNKYQPGRMEDNRKVFLQLIAGVGIMHKTGVAHNNMHGKNVMLNEDLELTIIDFGNSRINDPGKEKTTQGKADLHELQTHLAVVIGCKAGKKPNAAGHQALLACVKNDLGADAEFLSAFDKILEASENNRHDANPDSVVAPLWKTKFMQTHHPGATERFVDPKPCHPPAGLSSSDEVS